MKWRKILVVFLAAILCVGLLAGCGESKDSGKDKDVEIEEVDEKEDAAADEKESKADTEKEAKPEKTPEAAEEPEEEVTAEDLLNGYYELSKDVKTISFDMLLALDMKLNAMDSEMAQDMKMDIHFETDKENSYMVGSMEGNFDGENETNEIEQYVMKEDGKLVTYSYDKESDSWSVGDGEEVPISEEMIPQPDPSAFELKEKGDQYIVSGSIEMSELIESSGETMSEMFGELVGASGIELSGMADLEYVFDKETRDLKSVKIDLATVLEETFMAMFTEMLSSQDLGEDVDLSSMFEIKVDGFDMEISDIVINEDIEIVLPEKAKKGAGTLSAVSSSDSSSADSSSADKGPSKAAVDFTPFTPIDNDECAVTVTDLDPEGDWGYTVSVELENKSKDMKYEYSIDRIFVNGLEASGYLYEDVAAGKKAMAEIELDSDQLSEYGIDEFTDIEIKLRVQDADDWSADPAAEETFHIYPFGEEKAEKYVREAQASDIVLADENGITAIITDQWMDDIWGFTLEIYIVNNTDKVVRLSTDDSSINGYMSEPSFYVIVYPGKSAFKTMSWSTSELEKNKITDIEEVEFVLSAEDYDDYSADPLITKTITLSK
ncbi:MAG: hypothetical protein IKG70_04795 [Lachnospiraceae bacterium]|nr:hypothetical protein [Lachnospiraceae bacterium]